MLYEQIKGVEFLPVNQEEEPAKWLDMRTQGIGGSDVGAIMGCNPFSTKLVVYMAKKGVSTFNGNKSTEWGHILEDPIRKKTAEELNVQIETVPGTFRSEEHPFMLANLDGLIYADKPLTIDDDTVDGLGGHEIKTSSKGDGWGDGEIPDSYYWQVQHYMAVTNLDWFVVTVFILSSKTARHYIVRRNDVMIQAMLMEETKFWFENVEANNPPEPEGCDTEMELVKSLPVECVELTDELNEIIEEREELTQKIKDLTKQKDILTEKIILAFVSETGTNEEKLTATTSKYNISYNTISKSSVDTDRLKKDGLFDNYKKTIEYRSLSVKAKK